MKPHEEKNDSITFSDALARTVFNALSAHIVVIDGNGNILETNSAWQTFARKNGMSADTDFRKMNYLNICDGTSGDGRDDAKAVARGIREVLAGKLREFLHDYPCHSPRGKHWYYMRAVRMEEDGPIRVIISHEDITALKKTEEALRKSHDVLKQRNRELEETNITLKVLLKQRENDKKEMREKFLNTVKLVLIPHVRKLKNALESSRHRMLVEVIESSLTEIVSPMIQNLSDAGIILSPQELQVATLIRQGKTTREIAEIMIISEATVSFHRKNLRMKFGLTHKRTNLRSFLMSLG